MPSAIERQPVRRKRQSEQHKVPQFRAMFAGNFFSDATQTMIYPQTGQFSAPCGAINCVQPWTLGSVDGKPVKSYMRAVELFSIMGLPKAIELTEFGGENLFANYVVAQQAAKQILEQPNGLNQLQIDFMRSSANQGIKLEPLLGFLQILHDC